MPRAKGGSIPPPRVAIPPNHGGSISTLNENDVLSGRGGRINNHTGNITFRIVVEDYKREYLDPRTRKLEKAHVAARLVAQIRSANPPGRFLREDPENPGKYVEIGDQKAWKKAGQALREDAPDVRKEIDEDLEMVDEQQAKEKNTQIKVQSNYTPQHQPSYQQHQQPAYQQQQQHRPGVPPGIPPSVSYSPTSAQSMPLAPISGGGSRPDPPEAPGVTGYRKAPLRYASSGRGAGAGRGGQGGPNNYPAGRGRGPPPPHHPQQPPQPHPQQYPPQQGYHPSYYGHPPPMNQPPPPNQPHYAPHHGPPQPQFQQPPPQFPHQPSYSQYPPQQQHGHHPNQQQQQHNGYHNGPQPPQPQFTAPQDKQGRKKSASPIYAGPVQAMATGVHHTIDAVTGLANKFIHKRPSSSTDKSNPVLSPGGGFPLTKSIGSEFTMSDISGFGDSIRTNPAMLQSFQQEGQHQQQPIEVVTKNPEGGVQKDSKSSGGSGSGKSHDSFTMSDLMASNQSLGDIFGHSGRTRSFPDLMLSTGDLLPPMERDDGDVDILDNRDGNSKVEYQRTASGRMLRPSFHRHSSSESSNHSMTSLTLKGFHPVRGRINTATSGINDAMSIMSLDSRKSTKSESSSWLENFRSMQSIHSDTTRNNSLKSNAMGDEGSVRSFLSDVSNDLNALDLAEPLLPPIMSDSGLNDSLGEFMMSRPDP